MILRPLRPTAADAEAVRTVTAAAFVDLDTRPWPPGRIDRHHRRALHLAERDPDGCWIAEDAQGRPVGTVLASIREGTWGLSLLAVGREAQGEGVGKALLTRALEYGRGCLRGVICSSDHPAAVRAYRAAGCDLHPAMRLTGEVRHAGLAAPDGPVAPGGPDRFDLLDSVDRRLRGGARGSDHHELLRHFRLLVCDDLAGSGYCYYSPDGGIELLAATSRRLATRLLTTALLGMDDGAEVEATGLTAEQQWAVDVGLAAGLRVSAGGFVCLRGMRPPTPYVPSGAYL
ncbi:GNAT family N-acetyltransferase [Streptomyces sp. P38-E01]|uniref:GNAT family N-acetyltransferase n=1 Tax=Streptomyces tardus TaxID=2780544 RepID=A0A949JG81_9ACTN|nr:GNAT family N-acetyltransferase [Streptomyces tardus]MBU7599486.1 GNAT family N-acetyltransferase [Streptomyces tardus]